MRNFRTYTPHQVLMEWSSQGGQYVAQMRGKMNAYRLLAGKPEEK
jgi:hypothetical protein